MMKRGRLSAPASAIAAGLFLWALGCSNPDEGATLLHWAARTGNLQIIKNIVEEKKQDIDIPDSAGRTPLLAAAGSGKTAAVEYLIAHQANVAVKDNRGMNVLHYSAAQNYASLILLLLGEKYGAKTKGLLDQADKSGRRPIDVAFLENRREAAAALISSGSPVDAVDAEGTTLLHWACKYGYEDIVQLLIARKADLNRKDKKGRVPLHIAASGGYSKIVELLIAGGADATIPFPRGSWF
jgi:ankyrin repeat protein